MKNSEKLVQIDSYDYDAHTGEDGDSGHLIVRFSDVTLQDALVLLAKLATLTISRDGAIHFGQAAATVEAPPAKPIAATETAPQTPKATPLAAEQPKAAYVAPKSSNGIAGTAVHAPVQAVPAPAADAPVKRGPGRPPKNPQAPAAKPVEATPEALADAEEARRQAMRDRMAKARAAKFAHKPAPAPVTEPEEEPEAAPVEVLAEEPAPYVAPPAPAKPASQLGRVEKRVDEELGPIVLVHGDGTVSATSGDGLVSVTSPTADAAVIALREAVDAGDMAKLMAPEPKAPAPKKVTKHPAPDAELKSAPAFRGVMTWMLAHGYTTREAIVERCNAYRDEVPAIQRCTGDLGERVARALEVMSA